MSIPRSMFQIGPYDVIAQIGRDALGTTYLCGNGPSTHRYSVTHVDDWLPRDSRFCEALESARSALSIDAPHLVATEIGTFGYGRYLASAYVEGATLEDLLAVSPGCEPRVLARIVRDVLAGLATAHEGGHLHLHLSPGCLVIGRDGVTRVSALGLAIPNGIARPGLTPTTAPRLATEPPDERADIFAIGAIAWSALTGHVLFAGHDDAGTRERLLGLSVPPPSEVGARPVPSWDPVVLRALARDPAERYGSVRELDAALAAAVTDVATHAEVGLWVESTFAAAFAHRRSVDAARDPSEVPICTLRDSPRAPRRRRPSTGTARAIGLVAAAFTTGIAVALLLP